MKTSGLSVYPLRERPEHRSEMVTQILYGERYMVLESKENTEWNKIRLEDDGYEGWVDGLPIEPASDYNPHFVVCDPIFQSDGLWIPMGGLCNTFKQPEGIIPTALSMLGTPYLWGGKTVMGIDCSGFVQVVHKANGIMLPRDASQQINVGEEVGFADQQPGDLAYFSNKDGKITHVGIVLDKNKIIHASQWVRIDELRSDGIYRQNDVKTHSFAGLKRLV